MSGHEFKTTIYNINTFHNDNYKVKSNSCVYITDTDTHARTHVSLHISCSYVHLQICTGVKAH